MNTLHNVSHSKFKMPEKPLSYRQTLQLRRNYVGKSCKLHFEVAPLKIVRASRQYMYDDAGNEFLDCISNVSHVGHCHPHVVTAGQEQMARLTTCAGFLNDKMSEYARRLISTLPEKLCVCFFVNSGSEANDLALRLAKSYTKQQDIVVLENAYHGNLESLLDISPSQLKKMGKEKKEWVHIAPLPDLYRGKYQEDVPDAGNLYAKDLRNVIQKAEKRGRKIAAFICEPIMSASGIVVYPQNYLKEAYQYIHEAGGVCIADEVQSSLGRTGENYWAFQCYDVLPDIVTLGKPIGNGHPMAMVVTTKEIADSLGYFSSTFGGNPVACAVAMAVMDVIENEKLMSSAKSVGKCLLDGFRAIQPNHPMMGDVRGMGMMVGVELVVDKASRKPARETAEILAYRMKEKKIIIANEGPDKNVMMLTPPLCFTCDNARHVVQVFDQTLRDIEAGVGSGGGGNEGPGSSSSDISIQVLSELPSDASDEDEDDDPAAKRPRYEEMD